jgi:hypothetical protein
MTNTTVPTTTSTASDPGATDTTPIRRLRRLLTFDAVTCLSTGLVAVAAATAMHDRLGLASAAPMVAVGAFLVVYASVLAVLARTGEGLARTGAGVTVAGDALWVAATAALVVAGVFTGLGVAVAAAVGAVVTILGVEKALALR